MRMKLSRILQSRGLHRLLCWLAAGVFGLAAWGKLRDPLAFADSIAAYRLVPVPWVISLLALTLPVLEMLLAVLLVAGWWRRTAILGLGALTVMFTAALLTAWGRGLEIDCGCFSGAGLPEVPVPWAVARNVVLLAVFAFLWMREGRKSLPGG